MNQHEWTQNGICRWDCRPKEDDWPGKKLLPHQLSLSQLQLGPSREQVQLQHHHLISRGILFHIWPRQNVLLLKIWPWHEEHVTPALVINGRHSHSSDWWLGKQRNRGECRVHWKHTQNCSPLLITPIEATIALLQLLLREDKENINYERIHILSWIWKLITRVSKRRLSLECRNNWQ